MAVVPRVQESFLQMPPSSLQREKQTEYEAAGQQQHQQRPPQHAKEQRVQFPIIAGSDQHAELRSFGLDPDSAPAWMAVSTTHVIPICPATNAPWYLNNTGVNRKKAK